MSSAPTRVLIVAYRTAATPLLLAEVRERARRSACSFVLVVPRPYWDPDTEEAVATLKLAIPLLEEAAGGHVEGMIGDTDPLVAVRDAWSASGSTRSSSRRSRRECRIGCAAIYPAASAAGRSRDRRDCYAVRPDVLHNPLSATPTAQGAVGAPCAPTAAGVLPVSRVMRIRSCATTTKGRRGQDKSPTTSNLSRPRAGPCPWNPARCSGPPRNGLHGGPFPYRV